MDFGMLVKLVIFLLIKSFHCQLCVHFIKVLQWLEPLHEQINISHVHIQNYVYYIKYAHIYLKNALIR